MVLLDNPAHVAGKETASLRGGVLSEEPFRGEEIATQKSKECCILYWGLLEGA
jgi:hypothetical protein